jgi:hypothetical protein
MTGKSKRGKHLPRSKRKGRKTFTAPAAPKPVAAQVTEPAPEAKKTAAPPAAKPKAPVTVAQFSNVVAELRRIGIVAGVMIVILIILALIFA